MSVFDGGPDDDERVDPRRPCRVSIAAHVATNAVRICHA